MSSYSLIFPVYEMKLDSDGIPLFYFDNFLPHSKEIMKRINNDRNLLSVDVFSEEIAEKIESIKIYGKINKGVECSLKVTFKKGTRRTAKLLTAVYDQLHGIYVDGYGESLDMSIIPGVASDYRISV